MALKDLEGVGKPDARGGRPKKKSTEGKRDVPGNPFTRGYEPDDYWERIWNKYKSDMEDTVQTIGKIADESHCLTRTVIRGIQESEAHDFEQYDNEEWEEWINEEEPTDTSEFELKEEPEASSGLEALINYT